MIRVFIGYSRAAPVAGSVAAHSLLRRASQPVSIMHLAVNQLGGLLTRPHHPLQSTDFSFSRFLVPYLCGFAGWAIFMDDDMAVQEDVAALYAERDPAFAVQVVKQQHEPETAEKFLGKAQTRYEKKNWSSVMLFNCAKCTTLSPQYVNAATGLDLHQFRWLVHEGLIGALSPRWNQLVGSQPARAGSGILHYTEGGPFYDEYRDGPLAADWLAERAAMLACTQRSAA